MIRSRWAGAPGRLAAARRLALGAAAATALFPVLAGCEAGTSAPTLQYHPPTDSATENAGSIFIRNVFVLGAPLGRDLAAGNSASVFLALINTVSGRPDVLESITAPGTATSVTLPAGGIPVTAGHPVYYSGPLPQIALRNLVRPVQSGSTVRLVLVFRNQGPVTMLVPVMPRAAQYATLAPPPVPASLAAAAHASHPAATPTPTPTP